MGYHLGMRNLSLRLVSRCTRRWERDGVRLDASTLMAAPWVRIVGWTSVATGALTVGYFVGRNLRARYRLNHLTPYDLYSHAGDKGKGLEYGVGI